MSKTTIDTNNGDLNKKYTCSYCGKPFSRSEHKARHERSHTGIKPFECRVCQHVFVRRDLLQRHIRTVHREVLLMRKSAREAEARNGKGELAAEVGGCSSKSDMLLELLVNSMIKVNSDTAVGSPPDAKKSVSDVGLPKVTPKGRRKRGRAGAAAGAEAGQLTRREARAVSASINKALGVDRIRNLYRAGMAHIVERKVLKRAVVDHVRAEPALAASVVCLGLLVGCPDDRLADDVWQACWDRSLEERSVTAVNLLVHVLLSLGQKRDGFVVNVGSVFATYQQFFVDHLVESREKFDENDVWLIFHLWVSLLRAAHEPTHLSAHVYDWFLQYPFLGDCTLKDLVYQVVMNHNRWHVATLDLTADALFADWLISSQLLESNDPLGASHLFQSGAEFHNAMVILLKKYATEGGVREDLMRRLNVSDHPSKFSFPLSQYLVTIQSDSHWTLLEAAWCRLIERLRAKQDKKHWFMDSMAEFPTIFVESCMIDETFATCAIPVFGVLESGGELVAGKVPMISDVIVFLIRLLEFEMSISSNKYCPNRLISMLKNPVIQLLLFIGHRLTAARARSQQESIAIDHFINRYVVNCNWLIDKQTEEELTHNLFDSQSLGYIGYHQLIQDFVSFLRDSVITEKLMKVQHLDHNIKLHLFDFAQQHYHNLHHPVQDLEARRLTDPWHSPQPAHLWMFSPQTSSRSMSIDSTLTDHAPTFTAAMSQSNSLDGSMLQDPNVLLPPLHGTLLVRPQQKPNSYKYGSGSSEPQMNQRRPSSIVPTFTSPNFTNMDGVFLDKGENGGTSPRSSAPPTAISRIVNNSVRLPPPSELFSR